MSESRTPTTSTTRPTPTTPTTRGEGSTSTSFSSFTVSPRDRGPSETRSSGSSNPQASISEGVTSVYWPDVIREAFKNRPSENPRPLDPSAEDELYIARVPRETSSSSGSSNPQASISEGVTSVYWPDVIREAFKNRPSENPRPLDPSAEDEPYIAQVPSETNAPVPGLSDGSSNPQAPIPVSGNVYIGYGAGLLGPRTEELALLAHDGTLLGEDRKHLAVAYDAKGTIDLRNNNANTIEFGGTAEGALGDTNITILADGKDRIKTKLPFGKDQAVSVARPVYKDGDEWAFALERGDNSITIKGKTLDHLKSLINNSDMDKKLKDELLESVEAKQEASSSSSTILRPGDFSGTRSSTRSSTRSRTREIPSAHEWAQ